MARPTSFVIMAIRGRRKATACPTGARVGLFLATGKKSVRDHKRQNPSRVVLPLVTAAVAAWLALTPASAGGEQTAGEVISNGSAPFTETWDQMQARDALQLSAIPAAGDARRIAVHDRPIDPRAHTRGSGPPSPIVPPPAGPAELVEPRGPGMIGAAFEAISLQDQVAAFAGEFWIPPDTMGAIGPNHFVEVINGSVAIFSRQGAQLSHVSLDSFFFLAPNFPRNRSFDPRVLFDRRSDRWFALATEFGDPFFEDNDVILAVSRTNDPTGVWDKYVIPVGVPSGADQFFTDFPSLAVDDNGVYIGATIFPLSGADTFSKIAATPKASLIAGSPSLGVVTQFSNITDMYSTPQPANNHDAVGPTDPVWFMGSSALVFADIVYRTLTWNAGVPILSATTNLTSPAYAAPINAPANGSAVAISVGDDRIQNAVIRNDRLWTCRNVGVNIAGSETNPNRTACEWFELNVSSLPATIVQRGRVFDAGSPQRFYYYPSIMVNGLGHVAMGFSGSRSNEFVSAFVTGRLASDPPNTMVLPILLKAGTRPYQLTDGIGRNRWGDYSYTSLDPNDDMSFWTIQEFATGPSAGNVWSTWVAQGFGPGPAVPTSVNPPELEKGTTTDVTIGGASAGGTAFYDPGAGFANRLMVAFDGGGITVNSVTFNGPTQITANITVDAGAASGGRVVTVTNPDGQSASSASPLLTLLCNDTPPLLTDQPQDAASCLGAMASFSVAVTSPTPLTFQWRKNGVNINGATSSAIVIDPVGLTDQGDYDVVVNNECASITSDAASLNALSPEILGSPGDLMIKACETVTIGVLAEGPGMLTYQWRKNGLDLVNGGDISGATTPSLSIKFVTLADAGIYDVLCTSDCGPILSNSVELKIVVTPDFNGMCPDPAISLLIANAGCAQCNPGGTALLSAALVGCGILVRRRR